MSEFPCQVMSEFDEPPLGPNFYKHNIKCPSLFIASVRTSYKVKKVQVWILMWSEFS
ncbi:hypothetical protein Hanom_Chr11g00968371 [Helianthus anomalus]